MDNDTDTEQATLLLTFSHGMVFMNPDYDPEDPESTPAFLGFNTEIAYNPFEPDDLRGALEELISMLPTAETVEKYAEVARDAAVVDLTDESSG